MEFRLQAMEMWYQQLPGSWLLEQEQTQLDTALACINGEHALQMGGPRTVQLMRNSPISYKCYLGVQPARHTHGLSRVQSSLEELPFSPDTFDCVLLVHMLEFSDHPQQVLREIHAVLTGEGRLIILGFNPNSTWGWARKKRGNKGFPWQGEFRAASQIKQWLQQAGFNVVAQKNSCFRPPCDNASRLKRYAFMDMLGPMVLPMMGGVYMIIAQKSVVTGDSLLAKAWKKKAHIVGGVAEPTMRG